MITRTEFVERVTNFRNKFQERLSQFGTEGEKEAFIEGAFMSLTSLFEDAPIELTSVNGGMTPLQRETFIINCLSVLFNLENKSELQKRLREIDKKGEKNASRSYSAVMKMQMMLGILPMAEEISTNANLKAALLRS